MFDLQIQTIELIESLRMRTSSRIHDSRQSERPVRKIRFHNKDQPPLVGNHNSRTTSNSYTRAITNRIKSIISTNDDKRSSDQPKRETNKPFMVDKPSKPYTKRIIRRRKTIRWTNGDKD